MFARMPPNALEAEAQAAIVELLATIKVTARGDDNQCPTHKPYKICSCPSQVDSLTSAEVEAARRNRFLLSYFGYLLHYDYTWFYSGDQASHTAFGIKHRDTPKHCLREFLRADICKRDFAPAGKQSVTLDALLKVWVAKNAEWKSKHSTQKAANDAYMDEVRRTHMGNGEGYRLQAANVPPGAADAKPGTIFGFYEYNAGPPWHDTRVHVLPHTFAKAGEKPDGRKLYYIDVRIAKLVPCHADCEETQKSVFDTWPEIMIDVARRVHGMKGDMVVRSDKTKLNGQGGRWTVYKEDEGKVREWEEAQKLVGTAD